MSVSSKVFFAVVLMGALAFAQDDYGYYGDSDDYGSNSYSDDSYSGGYSSDDSFSNSTYSDEPEVGSAAASGDEWAGFQYEEMGLTQWEFQQAKDGGISREKLTQLVEVGVRPSEYLQHPWFRLGVSEEDWLDQRAQGLEDSDIDRSYRNRAGNQNYAYLSFLVPSLYQWHTNQKMKAIWMDVLEGVGIGATIALAITGENSEWVYGLIPIIVAHAWSGIDAFFGAQNDNNPDANRFSFGVGPTLDKGVSSVLLLRF